MLHVAGLSVGQSLQREAPSIDCPQTPTAPTPTFAFLLHSRLPSYILSALQGVGSVLSALHPLFAEAVPGHVVPTLPDPGPDVGWVGSPRAAHRLRILRLM